MWKLKDFRGFASNLFVISVILLGGCMELFRLYFLYVYYEHSYDLDNEEYGDLLTSFLYSSVSLFLAPCLALSNMFFEFFFPNALSVVVFENYKGEISVATLAAVLLSFVPMYYLRPRDLTIHEIGGIVRSHRFFEKRSVIKLIIPPVAGLIIIICIISK